jgi:DNA (cytosine-5)-methyltransferase 1
VGSNVSIGIPVLSFFTGGGFLDLGFEKAGFNVVWTNEINPVFADMYEHGVTAVRRRSNPAAHIASISARVDISLLTKRQILSGAFGSSRPKLFGVIGGPPCPDFSNGGKHKGHEGDHGRLSRAYIDLICNLKPAFFVMENVPGLYRNRKHRIFLLSLQEKLRKSGFVFDLRILNALEFGVPQDRPRLFLIGLRKDVFNDRFKTKSVPDDHGWFPFPDPLYPGAKSYAWPRISAFGESPAKPNDIPEDLMVFSAFNGSVPLEDLPNGREGFAAYSTKVRTVAEGDVTKKSFKRLHRYRYSPTACYGNNEVHLHPWEPRRLTVREALRIQSVPDEYVLPPDRPLSAKFKMIANGVPVELARHLARALYDVLTG